MLDDIVDSIRVAYLQSLRKTLRPAEQEFHLPSLVHHKLLHFWVYKLTLFQELTRIDKQIYEDLVVAILDNVSEDKHILRRIYFADEARSFHTSGKVNKHNVRIRVSQTPNFVREQVRDSPKVNVYCCITYDLVIGPFFFQEQIINGILYLVMLENYVYLQLEEFQPS